MPSELYGEVLLAADAVVGEYCVLGCPKEARLQAHRDEPRGSGRGRPVRVGSGCVLGHFVVLHQGVELAGGCVLDDRVRIGYDTAVGAGSRVMYGAYVCDRVRIGEHARVAGFVCDASVIGGRATVLGQLVHELAHPHGDWWGPEEPPPVIEADSVIGFGAQVIGGVRVGPRCYVAAGAVVTVSGKTRSGSTWHSKQRAVGSREHGTACPRLAAWSTHVSGTVNRLVIQAGTSTATSPIST